MVDFPLAVAEGFRNVPRLWGRKVKEQEEISGWKSGAAVAGKVHFPLHRISSLAEKSA